MATSNQDQERSTAGSNCVSDNTNLSEKENGELSVKEEVKPEQNGENEKEEKKDGNKEIEEDLEDEEIEEEEEVVMEEEEEVDEEEDEEEGVETDDKVHPGKVEKPLDHDQDRRNPQYIPKGGAFYEHDNRTSLEDVENKDPQEVEKKKRVWKESKESERWLHDWYKESEQLPKTKAEIIETYGYDIRNEEAPPRARRRRKYGRGPDKYERNWEDEQAYMVKQNGPGRRGKKKSVGKEEFPPLPNRKNEPNKTLPKTSNWKKSEDESGRNKSPKINPGQEKFVRNDQGPRNNLPGYQTNKRNPGIQTGRKVIEDEIKPFRNDKTKWKNNNNPRRGKMEEVPKANRGKVVRQEDQQTLKNTDLNKSQTNDLNEAQLAESFGQMTFHGKHPGMRESRQESNDISEQEMDSPANRLNPKRYSKNRKGFTGFFPPEEIVEIDPEEMKQLQQEQQKNQHLNLQQQPLNIQSVIRRYPPTYNGNPGYMAPRPIITGIPQQGMSPQGLQQALSPQGIPQQALSPQVPTLQTIEIQQGPLAPQPNFVPSMYIDMDPHYPPSDMMGPYTGYAPYSTNQPGEMYQPSGGITYYNTECQNSSQVRPPPARRQKAAIPILPPPE